MKEDDPIIEAGPGQSTLFYKGLYESWRKAVGEVGQYASGQLVGIANPSTIAKQLSDPARPGDHSSFCGVKLVANPIVAEGEVWLIDESAFLSRPPIFPDSVFDQIRQEEVRQSVAVMIGGSLQSEDAPRYLLTGCEGDQPVEVPMRQRVWLAVRMVWFRFIDLFKRR